MYENDYVWLLKAMSGSSMNLNHLYNLNIKIPEIILLKSGEPKVWFYQEKDQIKTRNENYLKLRLVKEYFADPQAVNDPQMFDFDFMMYSSKQTSSTVNAQKVLFCVTIENPAKEIKIIKKITKRVADELFSNVQENLEFCKQWTKVFSYLPSKNSGLFEVCLTRGLKDEKPKLKITRRDFSLQDIKLSDFSKHDDRRTNPQLFPKTDKMLSNNNFPSLATTINEILEKTIKSIARFLEARTELVLGELNLEFVVDASYTVWVIGSKGIYFYNSDGELDKDTEKENIEFRKETLKNFFTCSGSYCKFTGETNFHQEGDEATNLYEHKKNEKAQTYEIPYKSIILDLIERSKHVDRLCDAFPDYGIKQIVRFVETHPFEFRKYYSIGEILQSYLFKGYRVSNMYNNVRVCKNCQFVYEKTDGYRLQNILKSQNRKFNREEAKLALEKYFEKPQFSNDKERREVFSEDFYKKLGNFDKPILQILGLQKKTKNVEDFFELSSTKMRKLSPVTARSQGFYSKSVTASPQSVRFPVINKEIISDPDNIVNRERLTIADKGKAEMVGYKHFLGHAQYLADSGAGYALSKSSIRLNRLQDKLNRFNFVIDSAIEVNSFNETENDSETQDEMHKKSLEPIHEDFRPLNHKRIKELQASGQSSDNRKSSFHVAVDKIDFFSEKEKAALFEKENRKKEKETQQKKFLASHNLLAQSISSPSNPLQKKSSLPQIVLTEPRSPDDL